MAEAKSDNRAELFRKSLIKIGVPRPANRLEAITNFLEDCPQQNISCKIMHQDDVSEKQGIRIRDKEEYIIIISCYKTTFHMIGYIRNASPMQLLYIYMIILGMVNNGLFYILCSITQRDLSETLISILQMIS
jgi:hypothetical protein